MSNNPRHDLIEVRRKEAAERQEAWEGLSVKEKLAALDNRLGKGVGAKKQREALNKALKKS